MGKHTILCIDDEIDNVEALERIFRKNFAVLKATSGEEGIQILDQYPGQIAVIITDQRMPNMTGVELLEKSLVKHPDASRILLTGYTDIDSIIGAVNKGQIFRYISKPWDSIDFNNTVERAAEKYQLTKDLKLKNQELEKALTELRTLDKAKSDFMILVNHELRTPLTGLLSFLELLNETNLNEEQFLLHNRAKKNAERLQKLIDDVLLLMRSENNQIQLNISSVDPMAIIKGQCLDLNGEINKIANTKQLQFKFSECTEKISTDPNYFSQITSRILQNACKFSTSNSELRIQTIKNEAFLEISIQNKGPNISSQTLEKVFKPFLTNENMMNHSASLGLSLSICNSLLKHQNSSIQILNMADGVDVRFLIPLVR